MPGKIASNLRPLAALCAFLLAPAIAQATTAHTAPMGYVRHDIPAGFRTVGVTLLHEPAVVARIAKAEDDGMLSLATDLNVGGLLEVDRPHYLELTQGPIGTNDVFVGERLEVDVAATIASGSNRVFIKSGDPTNTLPESGIDLTGYQATLRPHVTLANVFGGASAPIMQAEDEVYLYDSIGESFQCFRFVASPAAHWQADNGANADDRPIRPGEGVLVNRRSSTAATVIELGEVRTNDFVQPLMAGLNFVAAGAPVDQTPRTRLMDETNGFRAGTAGYADKFYIFSHGAWQQYFLAASPQGSHWCNPARPQADFSDAPLFAGTEAALVRRSAAFPDYVVPSPVN